MAGAARGRTPGPQEIAMPWGVEHLTKTERFAKAVRAGVDQFGGADEPRWACGRAVIGDVPVGHHDAVEAESAAQHVDGAARAMS